MRILYLHQYFNTPEMTGGTRSWEMARRLVSAGHEVQMLTTWREATDRKGWFTTDEAGISVHWLPVPYANQMSYRERIAAFGRFAWAASRRAALLGGDVVFATSTPLTIALPAIYASRRWGIPMVFEVRDLWPELPIAVGALRDPVSRGLARELEKLAYRSSERIVALSPGMKAGIEATGYPASRISVIPNSADLDMFDPSKRDPDAFRRLHPELGGRPVVAYTGTMGVINGVGYLVDVAKAALARRDDACFVVVGRGAQREQIQEKARRSGVMERNFFVFDPVPKNDVPDVLAASDIALSLFIDLEPMWANSANKFFDALASGTPVAINHGGWQADLLTETDAGLVLPADAPEVAADMLLGALRDRAWLEAAGRRARNLACERFGRDELAVQLEGVLTDALEAGRSPGASPC